MQLPRSHPDWISLTMRMLSILLDNFDAQPRLRITVTDNVPMSLLESLNKSTCPKTKLERKPCILGKEVKLLDNKVAWSTCGSLVFGDLETNVIPWVPGTIHIHQVSRVWLSQYLWPALPPDRFWSWQNSGISFGSSSFPAPWCVT